MEFNYTQWLDEVEQKAVAVNQRRFASLTTTSRRAKKTETVQQAYDYLSLFRKFVSLNRAVLYASKRGQVK